MQDRALRIAAVISGGAAMGLAASGAAIRTVGAATPQPFNISSPFVFWVAALAAAIYAMVGIQLALRLPRHAVPWIFLGSGVALGGVILTWAYAVFGASHRPPLDGIATSALINTMVLTPAGLSLGVLLLHLFPDGRPVDARSRRSIMLLPIAAALLGLGVATSPGSIGIFTGIANPLFPGVPLVGRVLTVAGVVTISGLGLYGCRSMWHRYRTGASLMREQIRWFVWAGGLGASIVIGAVAFWTLNPQLLAGPYEGVLMVFVAVAATLIPIACAIAVLRHGLYDIDRLVSRTIVYGALLAIIAGAYSAGLKGVDRLVVAITGQSSDLAAVLTTLVLAISFDPLKQRLTKFAKRFEDEPEAVTTVAVPDDAWLDVVATRVIERIEANARAQGKPEPGRAPRPARRRDGRASART